MGGDKEWDFDAFMEQSGVRPTARRGVSPAAAESVGLSEAEAAEFEAAMAAEAARARSPEPDTADEQRATPQAGQPQQGTAQDPQGIEPDELALFDRAWESILPEKVPDGSHPPTAVPSRRSLTRRGVVEPDAEIDLHRLRRDSAITALERFVSDTRRRHLTVIKVIVGKGLHSEAGPVIKLAVESWLREDPLGVVGEFYVAPHWQGGDGALFVFLK